MKKPFKGSGDGPAQAIATRFMAAVVEPLLKGRDPERERLASEIHRMRPLLVAIVEAEWEKALMKKSA